MTNKEYYAEICRSMEAVIDNPAFNSAFALIHHLANRVLI